MRSFRLTCIYLLFFLCCISELLAQEQEVKFERLNIDGGLVHNSVLNIIQDSKGFMWFATYDGIAKYDGYNVKVYNFDPYDTTTISQNLNLKLYEDKDGNIWAGTAGMGLNKFDPNSEQFKRYLPFADANKSIHTRTISAIVQDQQEALWVGGVPGIARFDPDGQKYTQFLEHEMGKIISQTIVPDILIDRKGTVWVASSDGLFKIEGSGNEGKLSFRQFKHQPDNPQSLNSKIATAVCEDNQGRIWVGTVGGLALFDQENEKFIRYQHDPNDPNTLSSNTINNAALVLDEEGNLWAGTTYGLNRINPETGKIERFFYDHKNPYSLSSNDIHALHVDRSGILWIGTINGGICKLDPHKKPFHSLVPFSEPALAREAKGVRSIMEDSQGKLWVGTEGGGLYLYDAEKKSVQTFLYEQGGGLLLSNYITGILEDKDKNIWLGYGGSNFYANIGGLTKWKTSSNQYVRYDIHSICAPDFRDIKIFDLIQAEDGSIWISTENGIKYLDPVTGMVKHYLYYATDSTYKSKISDGWAYQIFEDKYHFNWVGLGSVAINRINPQTGEFTYYNVNPNHITDLTSHSVRSIYQDSKDRLWFGTSGGGLCLFDYETETFSAYTMRDGLPSNSIYSIEEDSRGRLWMGTGYGLSCFDPVNETFINFDQSDGLAGNQFSSGYVNAGSSFKGKDGTLYFGGSEGVTYFHPDDITLNEDIPPIALTQFSIFDQPQSGMHEAEQITLDYDQNFFSFEFAALNYTNAHQNQYAYQLEGFDRDWIYSGTRRYASYTNLNPGTYTFRVKGSNNDGLWNEAGTSVQIVILPPWWQTWWAYALYLIAAVCLLYTARQLTIKRERLKNELKLQKIEAEKMHEVDHLKSRFFANISHEFRTPLTLISSTAEKLEAEDADRPWRNNDYSLMQRYIHRLLSLINQLLDLSRLENNQLRVQKDSLEIRYFLQVLAASYTSLAESRGIQYSYQVPEKEGWVQADEDKLEKVIINLLSNAFKFTPEGGSVHFSAEMIPELSGKAQMYSLRIRVEDSGIGMSEQEQAHIFERFYQADDSSSRGYEGAGIGLALTREMLQLMHGEINVKSKIGEGTLFTVRLPLEQARQGKSGQQNGSLKKPNSEITVPAAEPVDKTQPSDKPQLLLAEDNADLRAFIVHSLGAEYSILEAANGAEALQLALDEQPELIISDVMMPVMDGINLCQKLRANPQTCHLPLIMLTARAGEENLLQGLEKGADAYLTKPFRMDELRLRIRKLLEQRQKLREIFRQQIMLHPEEVEVSSADAAFIKKLCKIMETRLSESTLDVETLSHELGMSRVHLHRKLKQLCGQSPSEFIRNFRLERAAALLEKESGNISEVAFAVGFSSLTHFSKCFRNKYGMSPSAFLLAKSEQHERSP